MYVKRKPGPSQPGKPGSCANQGSLLRDALADDGVFAAAEHVRVKNATLVLRREGQMNVEGGNHLPAAAVAAFECHRPTLGSGVMQVRYRYRIYPGLEQQQTLARAFGCARVVYNDCVRVRDECHAAGVKVSDTEVQRRVITLAKGTPERAWLGEVASVALVQACQDARRAYRNWLGSLSGTRKGRRIGHPRFRSRKDHRQSIRLTRNGFALHGTRLYLAKVGRHPGPVVPGAAVGGVKDSPKPLHVRRWTCAACGAAHDRDVNAARNILALGRGERLNACGGDVRPGQALAVAGEAGTHRSTA